MPTPGRKRELGRGERVLPGVWRLRLPLPWPGIPHGNAWAIAAGDGVVLVDTGIHDAGSMYHLERALDMVNLRLDLVRLLVCTHAHADHSGQAATIVARTGCELWMHPNHGHMSRSHNDPVYLLERQLEIARQSGVPEASLQRYLERRRDEADPTGIAGIIEPNRPLVNGVTVDTDLGPWEVVETPGHAPSHVCLFQRERRLMVSGDHLLGRISLYYDYGYSPDPAGEFLQSLERVEDLAPRLCLPGHGRTFNDVEAHIHANRRLVAERIQHVLDAIGVDPLTVVEIVPHVYGRAVTELTAHWWLSETLCYLQHLEMTGRAVRVDGEGGNADRWSAV
jgi:glyoxylase-like metal-dependent hydrolase (beta-lactamase superfamily II)